MRRAAMLAVITVVLALGIGQATAQKAEADPGGDVLFGSETISLARDRDSIKVGKDLGQLARLRLRVVDGDLSVNDVYVVYASGETERAAVNTEIRRGTLSRWIDLKPDRFIREVQFTYRPRPATKATPRVEAYGELSPDWAAPGGRGKAFNGGWVLIAAQSAGRFARGETDVVPIGRHAGGVKGVRIDVKQRAVGLAQVQLVYTDGDIADLAGRIRIEAGTSYGPIDLDDTPVLLKEVRIKYRSAAALADPKPGTGGPAIIEIWAQY
jgi:hypothetical protein